MPYEILEPQGGFEILPPEPVKSAPLSRMEKFTTGLMDPINGGAQLLEQGARKLGIADAVNSANNWIADKTGLVGRLPEGGVDQQVRQREAEYQQRRSAAGESGLDGYRLLGNVASPANLAISAAGPAAAAGMGARIGAGAVGGAASSALNPVTGADDFFSEKAKQVGIGALFGGATAPLVGGGARAISPNASTNPQLQLLRQEGVRPTLGQTLGGRWNAAEEKLTSVPLVGDMIANARRGAAEDLNTAAYNRALAPIGQSLPRGAVGRDAVNAAEDAISAGYNRLLPNLTFQADQQFTSTLGNLRQMVQTGAMDPRAAASFERILQNDVLAKFGGQGAMTGETFKRVESDLGQHIRRLAQSTDADQRLVGDALETVQAEMRQVLTRSNPAHAGELTMLNRAWANFKRPQRAAAALGAEDGIFSPAQLQSAVKALDRSKDKARFARGDALMQDLSEAGKTVLGSKVPDSGTPGRAMLAGLSLLDPSMATPALLGAGAMLYTRPMQGLLSGAVAARPQGAQALANSVRNASPMLVPLGAQVGLGLLN